MTPNSIFTHMLHATYGRHRDGAFLRPQAEALTGVHRGRPAGHPPAGRPWSGVQFWQGGCHGLPRPRSPARQGPRTIPTTDRRTHRPGALPQMRRAAARTGPQSVCAMRGEAKHGLPRQGREAPGRRQAAPGPGEGAGLRLPPPSPAGRRAPRPGAVRELRQGAPRARPQPVHAVRREAPRGRARPLREGQGRRQALW